MRFIYSFTGVRIPPGGPKENAAFRRRSLFHLGGIRTRKGLSVKKVCRRHAFSEERRSGYAASRSLQSRR